ncbi:MAG: hypothetical protein WA979_10695 [Pacificimonas sp.]
MPDRLDHVELRVDIRPPKPAWKRWSQLVAGIFLCLLAPPLGGLAPGPLGFAGFALGLTLILRNSRWAKKRYVQFVRRWPKWGGWSDWLLRRGPRPGKALKG